MIEGGCTTGCLQAGIARNESGHQSEVPPFVLSSSQFIAQRMAGTMAAIEGRSGCVAHSSAPTNSNLGATLAAMSGEARLVSGGDSGAAASEPEDCCCCDQTELGGMA